MTINLSQHAGGGNTLYVPGMMLFDGLTGYYSKTYTVTGNLITTVVRFNEPSFTGGGSLRLNGTVGGTNGRWRTLIIAYASDHSTVELRDKVRMYIQNSVGTVICDLLSSTILMDSSDHVLFASFDGDNGLATYYIDSLDADDSGYSGRTLIAGTLESTSSAETGFGADYLGNDKVNNKLGFCGVSSTYLTNPLDFMNGSKPRNIEATLSTVWGGDPLFWNEFGRMEDNKGTAGDMVANGTIISSFVGTVIFPHLGINTIGDAVAADIALGKIAWVDGVEIVGTAV